MAFEPPQFNLPLLVWRSGNTPFADPPDIEDLTCQLFVLNRMTQDLVPGSPGTYSPPIILRIPTGFQPLPNDTYGVGGNTTTYYKHRWGHLIHWGFPNQYWAVEVEMTNDDGSAIVLQQII